MWFLWLRPDQSPVLGTLAELAMEFIKDSTHIHTHSKNCQHCMRRKIFKSLPDPCRTEKDFRNSQRCWMDQEWVAHDGRRQWFYNHITTHSCSSATVTVSHWHNKVTRVRRLPTGLQPDCLHGLRTTLRYVLALLLSSFSWRVCRTKLAFS